MSQCNTTFDLKIFHGPVIFSSFIFALKNILVLLAMRDSGQLAWQNQQNDQSLRCALYG